MTCNRNLISSKSSLQSRREAKIRTYGNTLSLFGPIPIVDGPAWDLWPNLMLSNPMPWIEALLHQGTTK